MNMIKRAVNDVINVLTKLNKLNLKEKVYLCVLFIVLYFVVKMVMKQFFVTEHLTLERRIRSWIGLPSHEEQKAATIISTKMAELEQEEINERDHAKDDNTYLKIEKVNVYDNQYASAQTAPPISQPPTEARRQVAIRRIERFANRTKLMASLDKK
jgi:hypothetical protein